jgi:hypothetical protein
MSRIEELREKLGLPRSNIKSAIQNPSGFKAVVSKPTGPIIEPSQLFQTLVNFDFYHLDPLVFEELIGNVLKIIGFDIDLTPRVGDHGIDIMLKNPSGSIFIVQCKRYQIQQQITPKELREFLGSIVFSKANGGFFITTSSYTEQCREFCKEQSIYLIDGNILKDIFMLAETIILNPRVFDGNIKKPEELLIKLIKN